MELNGHDFEYFDDTHTYLVDGVIVPSITQILKYKFGKKYEGIDKDVLKRAADAGTKVHEAIEAYCILKRAMETEKGIDEAVAAYYETGMGEKYPEVRNFQFLKKHYKFEVLENEVPVILQKDGKVIGAGRLDLVLEMDGKIGGADIKRTSTLDKEYLAYQLNLYRIAYRQTYGIEWEFLRGVHLRNDVRKFVTIPIKEPQVWEFLNEWEAHNEDERKMDASSVSPFERKKVDSDS